jgi:putative ABC transport system substrate-binding protein
MPAQSLASPKLFPAGIRRADRECVAIEYRFAENQLDRLPALATDLVRRRVAVILANGIPATLAAKAATATLPIVFGTGADPVALGLVAGLNRPGTNVTGIAALSAELVPKRLQLLRELMLRPTKTRQVANLKCMTSPSATT